MCSHKMNDFGFCGDCWSQLSKERRQAITGEPEEQVRVVTYTIPAQPSAWKRALAWAVGSFAGTSAALALWKFVGG